MPIRDRTRVTEVDGRDKRRSRGLRREAFPVFLLLPSMRGRPKLQLFINPNPPRPGQPMHADLRLISRSETPIDGIEMTLRGVERRINGMVMAGNVPVASYTTQAHVGLTARKGKRTLGKGEHTVVARFDLPPGIPPAYRSRYTTIEYELDVHVSIPWWPDRRERYLVDVGTVPLPAEKARPVTFCNVDGGPRGKDLYIEASIDRPHVEQGGVLTGALSIANVAYNRIKRVELAFVAIESSAPGAHAGHHEEVSRYVFAVVPDGSKLVDGAPIPFRLRFPEKGVPSFTARFIQHGWQLEVRAVVSFGSDVTLRVPIVVSSPSEEVMVESSPVRRVAPVGRERRALVWAEVARRAGMENDAERERMTTDVGDVQLAITLEHRGDEGICSVASMRWPSLGIDVHLSERRWVDAFKAEIRTGDAAFHERFTVRAREPDPSRLLPVFGPRLRAALLAFEDVALDDEGCALASRGGAHSLDELSSFVTRAREAATAMNESLPLVPFPTPFATQAKQWGAFAERLGGRLHAGRPMITAGTWDRETVEVGVRWNDDGELAGTFARARLPRPIDGGGEGEDAKALVRALENDEKAQVRIERQLVEASFDRAFDDPAAMVPVLDRLAVLARIVRGERDAGPYR
jgi:hypothetical protein